MKYHILTFGCQMNVYDTKRLERYLLSAGYEPARGEEDSDLLVLNTCSIRDSAESRVYGTLGRFAHYKEENPNRQIAVMGCMAQKEGERIARRSRVVDVIAGTHAIPMIPTMLARAASEKAPQVDISKSEEHLFDEPDNVPSVSQIQRYPVFSSIMQGCNKVCSFCVVPYTRGKEVCRPPEQVFDECLNLVSNGFREVTLIGQNVDSYRYEGIDFADLLVRLSRIEGLERIRFTTSHPQDITPKLIDTVGELPQVCENFHFPLQSGSDRILKEMKRGYTVEEYFEKLEYMDRVFGCRKTHLFSYGASTDLMVGFANETEAEFEQTLDCVRRAQWDSAFMFKYSKREKTAAYPWRDEIPEEVKSERLARLIELQESMSLSINERALGKTVEVLIEAVPGYDPERPIDFIKGRTRTNKVVSLERPENPSEIPSVGSLALATITEVKPVTLRGRLAGQANHEPLMAIG